MTEAKGPLATKAQASISASEEWFVYIPPFNEPQPYRSAPTTWPISAEELSRTEAQAQSGNASALNNLGTNHTQLFQYQLSLGSCFTCVRGDASVWLGRAAHQSLQSL
jgi:hypothetical protein